MKKEVRKSNFELLRILCMILIIFHHFYVHGFFDVSMGSNILKMLIISFIGSFGKCASLIFILITGYFMVEKKVNYKRVIKLIFQFFIYNIFILLIMIVINQKVSIKDCARLIFPIFWGNWFIISYIQLLIVSPFINKMIKNISKYNFVSFLLISIVCFFVIPTFVPGSDWIISNLGLFVIVYSIGAYVSIYDVDFSNKIYIISGIALLFVILGFDFINICSESRLINYGFDFDYTNSIFMLLSAVLLFLLFRKINIKSFLVNNVASSSLGIYLLHDNFLMRDIIWNKIVPNNMILNSNFFVCLFVAKIILVFLIFLLLDKLLMLIFGKFINMMANKLDGVISYVLKGDL